jgi:hypothetical protein
MLNMLAAFPLPWSPPWVVSFCALGMVAIGVALSRRTDSLGMTMVCLGATTIGAVWAIVIAETNAPALEQAATIAAGAALVWLVLTWVIRKFPGDHERLTSAMSATALVSGVVSGGILSFVIGWAVWMRVTEPDAAAASLNGGGLVPLGLLILSVAIAFFAAPSTVLPTALVLIASLVAFWTSLMIPSVAWGEDVPRSLLFGPQPGWWTWTFHLLACLSAIIVAGAVAQDRVYRSIRGRAWPDRLELLLQPFSRWPGYARVEATLAAMVLVLGVFQVVRLSGPGWALPTATALCALATGIACLFMSYRRWGGNTALLGMTLFALAYSAIATALAAPFLPETGADEYTRRMPIVLNAVLFGLWIAIAHWRWLAQFWDQQLLDGAAWTTAGRMIPYAVTLSTYLALLSVIVAFQMAIWPERAASPDADDGFGRMAFSLAAMFLLIVQGVRAARHSESNAFAAAAVAMLIAVAIFILVRLPHNRERGWLGQYGPMLLAGCTPLLLLLAERWEKSREWRAFAAPIWFLSLLFLPALALAQLLGELRLAESWIRPATMLVLAATYIIGGLREHRRPFLVLAAVLCVAAWT